tara:strand:+ start:1350 stop:1613 length:264 start_codon:yes stop_codon:yes gene_type:complete
MATRTPQKSKKDKIGNTDVNTTQLKSTAELSRDAAAKKKVRDSASFIGGRTGGPMGALGTGKNVPYWKAKKKLERRLKEEKRKNKGK